MIDLRDPAAIARDEKEARLKAAGQLPPRYPRWHIVLSVLCVLFGCMLMGNDNRYSPAQYEFFRDLGFLIFVVVHFDWRIRRSRS